MSKLNKPETVKLRHSLKKPDTSKSDHGSPNTPLQTRTSGRTSAATTTSTTTRSFSSNSSESVNCRVEQTPVTKKPTSGRSLQQPSSSKPKTATSKGSTSRTSKQSVKSIATPVKILPAGNLFPSGKVHITGMSQGNAKSLVLSEPSTKSYGYGSIIQGATISPSPISPTTSVLTITTNRGGSSESSTWWKKTMFSSNPEEVNKVGKEMFKKGCFSESLQLFDRAIELKPSTAAYHNNRAGALSILDRVGEAVVACEKAITLDPNSVKAHHYLATLLLRLGQVDNAVKHMFSIEEPLDQNVVKVLQQVDKHLNNCADARRRGEWKIVLAQVSSAMECGADFSPELAMCKVEALLKLLRLNYAKKVLAFVPKVEPIPSSFSKTRFFGMISEAYKSFVKSQMELALGRFENAVTAAEKASEIDPRNNEVATLYRNVRLIAKARNCGNDLYESGRYTEAIAAYGEGLKFEPYNATLLFHRADCYYKLGMWESSIEDCNRALLVLPSNTKALLQRAKSFTKLERWDEAVRDYENLRKELPYDKEIAESLFRAQVALKKSRGGVVLNMQFGCEVEEVTSLEELKAALTRPGVSIVLFMRAYDQQCKDMSIFMDALCIRYPSLHFLKVEIEQCREAGDVEKVRVVPTFKIYKLGIRMKEIVCPSKEALENSVKHYSR